MSRNFAASTRHDARTTHCVDCPATSRIVSHRLNKSGDEEFLLIWQENTGPPSAQAVASWHTVAELTTCLDKVQIYIHSAGPFPLASSSSSTTNSRKRKAPGADASIALSRDDSGLLTPLDVGAISLSRSQSPLSVLSSDSNRDEPKVYNGILDKREGKIVARSWQHPSVPDVDITTLPTRDMLATAKNTPVTLAEDSIWTAFARKLKRHSKATRTFTRIENKVDRTTPSLAFDFIQGFVLGVGTYTTDADAVVGCEDPCRPDMGSNCGCEYTKKCACLEFAAVDEAAFRRQNLERYNLYLKQKENGGHPDTAGLPKQFPYSKPKDDKQVVVTLRKQYRESRDVIYECNANCNCGLNCKSRLVQKGRRVPLTIFKTADRGWGVYCNEDLVTGEFIDTYLGEVITSQEADRREAVAGQNKSSYLYGLDKFVEDGGILEDESFVVDGEHMGGPTRFINHSCEPNCRQYSVSYNKYDERIYDLAFFAYKDIPKGTELTFDYLDEDELEGEELRKAKEARENDAKYTINILCNCGSERCRGYLW